MPVMMHGTVMGLLSYISLEVLEGGITEEIYNHEYFINVLKTTSKNTKTGLWVMAFVDLAENSKLAIVNDNLNQNSRL